MTESTHSQMTAEQLHLYDQLGAMTPLQHEFVMRDDVEVELAGAVVTNKDDGETISHVFRVIVSHKGQMYAAVAGNPMAAATAAVQGLMQQMGIEQLTKAERDFLREADEQGAAHGHPHIN